MSCPPLLDRLRRYGEASGNVVVVPTEDMRLAAACVEALVDSHINDAADRLRKLKARRDG